ncbi:hypothetical protein [Pseudomonas sp. Pseusp16]|uniref:hypothetical protein n=1 Tax=Pseudomonas sp. Pseusp16 TaxID=3243021 RepID=UPI0039B3ACBC
MTFKHQSPFKEGEVLEIQARLLESANRLHAESIVDRGRYRALFGTDWFEHIEEQDDSFADLDQLIAESFQELPESALEKISMASAKNPPIEAGLFAGTPSYGLLSSRMPDLPDSDNVKFSGGQSIPHHPKRVEAGVNANPGRSKWRAQSISTPGKAGLVALFQLSHSERLVAISELDPTLDHDQIQGLLKTADFLHKLAQDYQGKGELLDWAKFVTPEIKQFFRLLLLCKRPEAKTITIRLDHDSAEAALAAPRGPANYLAEIIKRSLAKLGIETDLAFNLEFNHTGSTENHPLHIHGALCIPDGRVDEVSKALRSALAEGYRQRYSNLAVHIEKPRSAQWWAAYCIKEYLITAGNLEAERGRKNRPNYATQQLTQQAKNFYKGIGTWLAA